MHNLANYVFITNRSAALAAGSTVHNYEAVDMSGYDGAMFIVTVSTFTTASVTNAHAEMSATSSFASASDIAGSAVNFLSTEYSADVSGVIDIYRPEQRWVRLVLDRATANASIASPIILQYNANKLPATYSTVRVADVVILAGTSSGSAT
jgi:hypothetical protein